MYQVRCRATSSAMPTPARQCVPILSASPAVQWGVVRCGAGQIINCWVGTVAQARMPCKHLHCLHALLVQPVLPAAVQQRQQMKPRRRQRRTQQALLHQGLAYQQRCQGG